MTTTKCGQCQQLIELPLGEEKYELVTESIDLFCRECGAIRKSHRAVILCSLACLLGHVAAIKDEVELRANEAELRAKEKRS